MRLVPTVALVGSLICTVMPASAIDLTQHAIFTEATPAPADELGYALAINAAEALVAARADGAGVSQPGWVRPWVDGGAVWSRAARFVAVNGAATHRFGESLGVSGTYAIVGAPRANDFGQYSGAAYVFVRGAAGWTQQAKLLVSPPLVAFDEYGVGVALDGDYAIVGSRSDDDGGSQSGSAYIYKRNGTSWPQQQKLIALDDATKDLFGSAVILHGAYALIGAPGDDTNIGSAYIFLRSGTTWAQQAKLLASDRAAGDVLATSVALRGEYAALGAPGDDSGKGSVYIFKRTGTAWAQVTKITLSGAAAGDAFGTAVSMTAQQLLIGAPGRNGNRGNAYLYERSGTSWVQLVRYLASDAAAGQRLGASVSLDESHALVGAPGHTGGSGAAYLFNTIELDCNANGVPDVCDTSCLSVNPVTGVTCAVTPPPGCGVATDCNVNSIPDACEPDCDSNGIADACDLAAGGGDCNTNGVPDTCEPDCNGNGNADGCDIADAASSDCDLDGVPDECGLLDDVDLLDVDFTSGLPAGWSANGLWHVTEQCLSGVPCDAGAWAYFGIDGTCNFQNGAVVTGSLTAPTLTIPTAVTTAELRYCSNYDGDRGAAPNGFDAAWVTVNGLIADDVGATITQAFWETRTIDLSAYAGQSVTLAWHFDSNDATLNNRLGWQIDAIEVIVDGDCDDNGTLDTCDVAGGTALDCNSNAIPDACDLTLDDSDDCNSNGLPDECEAGSDCDDNDVLDFCETVRRYVDADATGANTGTSWTDAYTSLQSALAEAATECVPVEVWVASGVYRPAAAGGARTATFSLSDKLAVYGGFVGGETLRAQRNPEPATNATILSGDLDGGGPANNSYHVVTAATTDGSALLDGFTIRDGVANGTNPHDRGAGILLTQSSATIVNCLITANTGVAGAISATGGAPTLTGCTIRANSGQFGGGLHIVGASAAQLVACRVLGNSSTAGGAGGGLYVSAASTPRLTNCALSGNGAAGNGGGLFVQSSSTATLTNCTLNRNSAGLSGGGVFASINSTVLSRNCILWENQDAGGFDQTAQLDSSSSTLRVRFSCVQGWTGSLGGPGNSAANPLLADVDGPDGVYGTEDDDVQLAPGSPCIDAGSNGAVTTIMDLAGLARRIDDADTADTGTGTPPIVDRGAHEFQSDCNNNNQADSVDVTSGFSSDCNENTTPDECEIHPAGGAAGGPYYCAAACDPDCNHNGVPDTCDIAAATSDDCAGEGVPDECEADCNLNGTADSCDTLAGAGDCDSNGVPDTCELDEGDCDASGVLDTCEITNAYVTVTPGPLTPVAGDVVLDFTLPDAKPSISNVTFTFLGVGDFSAVSEQVRVYLNGTQIGAAFDGVFADCPTFPNLDQIVLTASAFNNLLTGGDALIELVPTAEVDTLPGCNGYIQPAIQYQIFRDCNANAIPDDCEPDCNANGIADSCDISAGTSADCNLNAAPDNCDISAGSSTDGNSNAIPDDCELDCDANGVPDECDVACGNHVVASGAACASAFPLTCGLAPDCNGNASPDACDPDCDQDGAVDACAIAAGSALDCDLNDVPDPCDIAGGSADCDDNDQPDACQPDTDGDQVINACDLCPTDATKSAPGVCGCGVVETDADGDGVPNCLDDCPGTPPAEPVDADGCPLAGACCLELTQCLEPLDRDLCELSPPVGLGGSYQGNGSTCASDLDGDGVANCNDACPDDSTKIDPEECGCHVAETDSDNDEVPNCLDLCPATAAGAAVDANGCDLYGACCSPAGGCVSQTFVTQTWCNNQGWTYGGNGSTCALHCAQRAPGDYNADGTVDSEDAAMFPGCLGQPFQAPTFLPPSALCRLAFDGDADGDVDLTDYAAFQSVMD